MRRRQEGPSGSQSEPEDMGRMSGATGSSSEVPGSTGGAMGPSGTGMQDTGGTTHQQPGARTPATTSYGRGTAPAPSGVYEKPGYGRPTPSRHGSALAILAGTLAFLEGLAFVIRSPFYPTAPGYAYRWTLHGWGWVLLILGALLIAGGVSHLLGIKGSRHFTAVIAVVTAVVAFITLIYSIIWGIIVLAVSAFAAHSLLSHRGTEERYAADQGGMGYGAGGESYGGMGQGEEAASRGRHSHRVLATGRGPQAHQD
jgi:hypothetical protein